MLPTPWRACWDRVVEHRAPALVDVRRAEGRVGAPLLAGPPSCTRRCGDPAEGAQRDVHEAMGEALAVPPRLRHYLAFNLCLLGWLALLRRT